VVNPATAGLKEEKNVREKHASPDPDLFGNAEFCEMLANLSLAFSRPHKCVATATSPKTPRHYV
jgi:hypothetical protein